MLFLIGLYHPVPHYTNPYFPLTKQIPSHTTHYIPNYSITSHVTFNMHTQYTIPYHLIASFTISYDPILSPDIPNIPSHTTPLPFHATHNIPHIYTLSHKIHNKIYHHYYNHPIPPQTISYHPYHAILPCNLPKPSSHNTPQHSLPHYNIVLCYPLPSLSFRTILTFNELCKGSIPGRHFYS